MSTPSIQTLITQAQQVLNLKSSNEIRATLAAILANANVGTPLNPNLTTQQLWDEFYEIVRQPSDDIMSIITDQMMRMVFSPPAPGGAGADKQVIFNDGGVLAGDSEFLWDKSANRLDVNGTAIITGGLTVRTNKLKVDSNGVGIGTASPSSGTLNINSHFILLGDSQTKIGDNGLVNGAAVDANTQIQYFGGKSLFFNEGAATRMTLNSTGLGIGGSPNYKLNVTGPATSFAGSPSLALYDTTVGSPGSRNWLIGNVAANNYGELVFCVSSAAGGAPTNVKMTLDASGNLGIGVTPSSWWTGFKAIESANGVALLGQTNVPFAHLSTNAYAGVPNWLYKVSNFALRYGQDGTTGNHQWLTAPSGTAGASAAVTSGQSYTVSVLGGSTLAQWQAFFSALAVLPTVGQVITATATGSIVGGGTVTQNITFTQAMTLDVSGNLLVGTATLSPTINGAGAITAKGVAGITLQTVSAILTDYTLPIGSFSGILTIRSNGGGGSAVFMLDPNAGAVSISNNIVGRTITFTFSGGSWKMQQTVGVVPSTYNYLVLANQ